MNEKQLSKKQERSQNEKRDAGFLCALKCFFGLSACICLILAIASFCCNQLNVSFNDFYNWAELFIITLTLSIVVKTYQRSKKVDEANMLINLRKLLMSNCNMTIHKKLLGQNDPKESNNSQNNCTNADPFWKQHKAEVYNYLGTLELMNIMLEDEVLDEDDFKSQFLYRLESVFALENSGIRKLFSSKKERAYWKHLYALKEKYQKELSELEEQ